MSWINLIRGGLDAWTEEVETSQYVRRQNCELRRIETDHRVLKARMEAQSELKLLYVEAQQKMIEAGTSLLNARMEAEMLSFLSLPLDSATFLITEATEKARLHNAWKQERKSLDSPSMPLLPPAPPPSELPPPPHREAMLSDAQVQTMIAQSIGRLRAMEPGKAEEALLSLQAKLREHLPDFVADEVAQKVREEWHKSRF